MNVSAVSSSADLMSVGVQSLPDVVRDGTSPPHASMHMEGSRRQGASQLLSRGVTPTLTPRTCSQEELERGSPRVSTEGQLLTPQPPVALTAASGTTAIPVTNSTGSLSAAKLSAAVAKGRRAPLAPLQNNTAASSQLVTPAMSVLTTPRCDTLNWAAGGRPQLAAFDSLGTTPCAASRPGEPTREEQPRDVNTPILNPDKTGEAERSYATIEQADSDTADGDNRRASGRSGRHHAGSDDDDIDYNSFAGPLESSFMSNGSVGGDGSRVYTTLGRATFHIFKGNVGAGVFLLPTYYQDSGYVLGALCVALLGLIMVDCVMVLLRSKTAIAHAEVRTYPAVVEYVLGYWFRQFTKFSLIFTQFGFCVIFVQYASSMFSAMWDFSFAYELCVILSIIVVTPMTLMSNNMQRLAYVSLLAGVFVATVLAGTTVIDIQYLATRGMSPAVVAAVPTMRIIVFLSGHMFSLEGIGVVLPVENSVAPENRGRFITRVRYTLFSIVLLYIVFGVLGYLAYGEALHTSVVLALPPSAFKMILEVLLGLSLLLGYPIQYIPAIQLVDKSLGVSEMNDKKKAYAVRIGLNVLFGVFALFIGGDTINIFASFLGAFVGVHLMITIPTLLALQLEHALSGERENMSYGAYLMLMFRGPYNARKIRYYVYLFIAIFVWIAGMYFTVASVFVGVPSSKPSNEPNVTVSPGGSDASDFFDGQ